MFFITTWDFGNTCEVFSEVQNKLIALVVLGKIKLSGRLNGRKHNGI